MDNRDNGGETEPKKKNWKGIRLYVVILGIVLVSLIVGGVIYSRKDAPAASPKSTQTRLENESYAVGTDIPAGDYVAYPTTGLFPKYKVTKDEYGLNILREEDIGDVWTITLRDGEYVFLSSCYLVPINETLSFKDNDFDMHIYDGKRVRLKVGYHIPAGDYVSDVSIEMYENLYNVDEIGELKSEVLYHMLSDTNNNTSKYIVYSAVNGQYCRTIGGGTAFLSLDESKDKVEIKGNGMYKVGVHIPPGIYTMQGASKYAPTSDFFSSYAFVTIYDNGEEIDKIVLDDGETAEVCLKRGQIVYWSKIEILTREDISNKILV